MKTTKKHTLSRAVETMVWVLMLVDLVLMIALPWLVGTLTTQQPGDKLYRDYLIILYGSGVIAELALWQCRGMLHNVTSGNPFIPDTVRRLRVIAVECLVMALLYLVFIVWLRVVKFFVALLLVVFAFIGMVLFVFAELFRQAAEYKAENDMTI